MNGLQSFQNSLVKGRSSVVAVVTACHTVDYWKDFGLVHISSALCELNHAAKTCLYHLAVRRTWRRASVCLYE